jgi:AcrR family transcriptional regulator
MNAKQARFLAQVRPLVEERGYDAVSVDAMAAAAGISKATFYRLFSAKEAVRAALRTVGVAAEQLGARDGREAILDAALVVFGADGYAGATVDAIAAAAGMSKAGLYWHFETKEAIFAGMIGRYAPFAAIARIIAAGEQAGESTAVVLSRVLTEIARAILPNHTLFRSIFFEAAQNPEIGAVFVRQVISNGFGILGGYLTRETAAGRLRPLHPMIAVQGLIGPLFIYFFTYEMFTTQLGLAVPLEAVIAQIVGTFLDGASAQ